MPTGPLLDNPWLAPLALAHPIVAGPVIDARLAGRPGLALPLAGAALLAVAALTLVPTGRHPGPRCAIA